MLYEKIFEGENAASGNKMNFSYVKLSLQHGIFLTENDFLPQSDSLKCSRFHFRETFIKQS